MTRKEFKQVLRIADHLKDDDILEDERNQAVIQLFGYGSEKKSCTKRQYAIVFNLQTMQLNGIRSAEAVLEELDCIKNIYLLD